MRSRGGWWLKCKTCYLTLRLRFNCRVIHRFLCMLHEFGQQCLLRFSSHDNVWVTDVSLEYVSQSQVCSLWVPVVGIENEGKIQYQDAGQRSCLPLVHTDTISWCLHSFANKRQSYNTAPYLKAPWNSNNLSLLSDGVAMRTAVSSDMWGDPEHPLDPQVYPHGSDLLMSFTNWSTFLPGSSSSCWLYRQMKK